MPINEPDKPGSLRIKPSTGSKAAKSARKQPETFAKYRPSHPNGYLNNQVTVFSFSDVFPVR
ncbi:hypothetical protein ACFPVS_10405, partial [Neisseria weixii]|uniref:hypothetical protein n=1 Tax=Neisseria weixii TaxID=1853276 RepID=UPI0036131049